MIDRREIRDSATRHGLNPQIIEKDFVLGWILAGINRHPALAESWVFKGGTCLKKCYFETPPLPHARGVGAFLLGWRHHQAVVVQLAALAVGRRDECAHGRRKKHGIACTKGDA